MEGLQGALTEMLQDAIACMMATNASHHLKEDKTTCGLDKQSRKRLVGQELPGSREEGQ